LYSNGSQLADYRTGDYFKSLTRSGHHGVQLSGVEFHGVRFQLLNFRVFKEEVNTTEKYQLAGIFHVRPFSAQPPNLAVGVF